MSMNGHELGTRPYGYASVAFDLTPHLRFGAENVLAVRLTPEDQFNLLRLSIFSICSPPGHSPALALWNFSRRKAGR